MRRSLTNIWAIQPVARMPQRTGLGDVFDIVLDAVRQKIISKVMVDEESFGRLGTMLEVGSPKLLNFQRVVGRLPLFAHRPLRTMEDRCGPRAGGLHR